MSAPKKPRRRILFQLLAGLPLLLAAGGCSSSGSGRRGLFGMLGGGNRGSSPGFRGTGKVQQGKASWYSIRTNRGRHTASGEPLSNSASTAAHRHLPLGTFVRVTNLKNNASQVVRITDRGPYIRGRIIDVTIGVGERLGMVNDGVVPVKVEVVEPIGSSRPRSA